MPARLPPLAHRRVPETRLIPSEFFKREPPGFLSSCETARSANALAERADRVSDQYSQEMICAVLHRQFARDSPTVVRFIGLVTKGEDDGSRNASG